jgi:uncharacterized damage-inducible protein DinB
MGDLGTMRRLIRYDQRVFEAYERGLRRRGWREAVKDRGIGHGSYKDTLVHILNVYEAWFVGAAQRRWEIFEDERRRAKNVRSFSDLRQYRLRVWQEVDALAARLKQTDLGKRVKVPWMTGRYTLEDAIFQVSFEQAHHLGEIIGAAWQSNRVSPQMMWIPTLLGTRVPVA